MIRTFVLVLAAISFIANAIAEDTQKLEALCKEEGARLVAAEAQEKAKFFFSRRCESVF
jgi:hypothetical protein